MLRPVYHLFTLLLPYRSKCLEGVQSGRTEIRAKAGTNLVSQPRGMAEQIILIGQRRCR